MAAAVIDWRIIISSRIRWMRVAILLAVLFAANALALAGAISVTSPDHPQTFTYGEMIWHQLYERTGGELAARITFSNRPYVGDDTPRIDEASLSQSRARGNSPRAGSICRLVQKSICSKIVVASLRP